MKRTFWHGQLGKENRGCACKIKLSRNSHLLAIMLYLESQNYKNALLG